MVLRYKWLMIGMRLDFFFLRPGKNQENESRYSDIFICFDFSRIVPKKTKSGIFKYQNNTSSRAVFVGFQPVGRCQKIDERRSFIFRSERSLTSWERLEERRSDF